VTARHRFQRQGVIAFCLLGLAMAGGGSAQEAPRSGPSWDFSHGDLKVSENKRFLVHADGAPFFYLSDTNWQFFHRARREDAERLLEKRRQQGFTVICGPVTGILDTFHFKKPLRVPNVYGDLPFVDADVTRPATTPGSDPNDPAQYDYWDHIDYLVSLAESKGLYAGLIPAWHDHYLADLINTSNARAYGRFLGKRYASRPNIIWVLGGDHNATGREEVFREMAAGLKESDGGRHLITFHPRGGRSSSQWFHNEPWLDFHMIQSGHGALDIANYDMVAKDYGLAPPKPTMDAENRYEDHAVAHNPEKGWFNDYDNRQAAYWGLFAGGHGHTYGNRGVWQMYEPGRDPSGPLRYYWHDAMDLPGAWDMTHVRNLMLSRPLLSRVPDQSLVEESLSGADHIRATRGEGYAFVYAATGRSFVVNLGKISGTTLVTSWFDPRTGAFTRIGEFPNTGKQQFDPPGEPGRGNDWVLVLDDKASGYSAPGER